MTILLEAARAVTEPHVAWIRQSGRERCPFPCERCALADAILAAEQAPAVVTAEVTMEEVLAELTHVHTAEDEQAACRRIAALVAERTAAAVQRERARLAEVLHMEMREVVDRMGEAERTAAAVEAAVAQEREACARVVDEEADAWTDDDAGAERLVLKRMAAAIRRTPASEGAQDSGESPSASGPDEEFVHHLRVLASRFDPHDSDGPMTCHVNDMVEATAAFLTAALHLEGAIAEIARLRAREEAVEEVRAAAEALWVTARHQQTHINVPAEQRPVVCIACDGWTRLRAALDALKPAQEQSTNDDLNADVVAGMRDGDVSPEEFAAILERSRHPSPPTPALVEAFAKYGSPSASGHEVAWHRLDCNGRAYCAPPCPLSVRVARSWCSECGPDVRVDEEGCCETCGCGATGDGADDAHGLRDEVASLRAREAAVGRLVEAAGLLADWHLLADFFAAHRDVRPRTALDDDLAIAVRAALDGLKPAQEGPDVCACDSADKPCPSCEAAINADVDAPPRDGECEDVSEEPRDCPHGILYRKRLHLCATCMESGMDRTADEVATLRRERDEAQSLIARDGWLNVENQQGLVAGVRYLLESAAKMRDQRDEAQAEVKRVSAEAHRWLVETGQVAARLVTAERERDESRAECEQLGVMACETNATLARVEDEHEAALAEVARLVAGAAPSEAVTSLHALCDEVRTRLESAEAQGRWPVGCGLSQALAMLRREREDRR